MKLPVQIIREVLDGKGDKRVRTIETMDATLEYDGTANIINSQHPDKTFGAWVVAGVKKD